MSLSKKQRRDLVRLAHLALGLPVGFLVYAPPAFAEPVRLTLQVVVFPALVLTGLWMWLAPKLAARARHTASSSRPAVDKLR